MYPQNANDLATKSVLIGLMSASGRPASSKGFLLALTDTRPSVMVTSLTWFQRLWLPACAWA